MGQQGTLVGILVCALFAACGGNKGGSPDARTGDGGADAAASFDAPPCITQTGLTGRWRGEGNANDSLGLYNGVAQGALTYDTGRFGQAFKLNGTDAYVSIDDGDALWPSGSFSVLAWVKLTNTGNYQAIVSKQECGSNCSAGASAQILLELEDGGMPFFRFRSGASGAGLHTVYGGSAIDDGTWHMVVGVRDVTGGMEYAYIDDKAPGTNAITGEALEALTNANGQSDPAVIGGYHEEDGTNIVDLNAGMIDEVAVIDRALTAQEIAAIYHAAGGICQ